MTQDFFADLERELVTAAAQRRARIRRARARRAATVSTILVAVLAGGAGLAAAVTGGGDGDGRSGTPAGGAPAVTATTPVSPRSRQILSRQTVAVLNATTVPGLARGVANRLRNADVTIGNVTNAAQQDRGSTCVLYAPGHEEAARRVAALLDLLPDAVVGPATKGYRAVAGDQASVIVVVGTNQDTAPQRP